MTVYSSLDQIIILSIPEVQKIFLQAMQKIVDRAAIAEMVAAIESNDPERLFRASGFSRAALNPILDQIEKVYLDAAETSAETFPKRIRTPTGLLMFQFDMRNPRVEEDLKRVSSALITRLTDEARDNVREVLQQGMAAGKNPRSTALDIVGRIDPVTKKRVGGVIGLTNNQTRWVQNTERYLKGLDSTYFNLKLRDKRFDNLVNKAIEANKPLKNQDVEKIVTAYKNRALKYRAETIARTETIQSLNRGEYMAAMEVIREGGLSSDAIRKYWDDAGDGRVRHTHRMMGAKYNSEKGIPVDQPFEFANGMKMMYPGDSSLGADVGEIVNCRCALRMKVDFLMGVE
jgi:hypothetical protein